MQQNVSKKKELFCSILLLLVGLLWGTGFIAAQMALDSHVSPSLVMMVRFSVAAVFVFVVFFKRIKANLKKSDLIGGLVVGTFLFLAFYSQIAALQYTTPGNNAFLTAANVVMVPFIWWAVSKKRPAVNMFIASVVCLVGVGLLSFKGGEGFGFSYGDILTLICAFFFACQIVATGRLAANTDTVIIVFLQFTVAAVFSAIAFFVTDGDLSPLTTAGGLGSTMYLGLVSTCLCYFMQTYGQKNVESSKAAILLSTESLSGTVFSIILGYDSLTPNIVFGGLVMSVAVALTEVNPKALSALAARRRTAEESNL